MQKLSIAVEAKALATLRTGVGQYTFQLYQAMQELADKPDIFYHIHNQFTQELPGTQLITPRQSALTYKEKLSKAIDKLGGPFAVAKKQLALHAFRKAFKQDLEAIEPDIIHCTDFFTIGNQRGIPEIITVHDLSCFKCPQTHPAARVKLFNEYLPISLENAQHILTVSEFSKREMIDYFNIQPEKISVTYCGVPKGFQAYSAIQAHSTLQHYGLHYKKFFLYVGSIEPRKNLALLLDAYRQLPKIIQHQYKLVIIGACGWKFEQFLHQAKGLLSAGRLIMPGYVADNDLQLLMASAHGFLYPSLYEGFGIPLIEAMASATPVITSDRASLPEVVARAGIVLAADDASLWAQAITRLIEDPQYYQSLVAAGLHRATLFDWMKTAEKTVYCFQRQARN